MMANDLSKAVFKADMESGNEKESVVVKFTDRYCEAAHQILARDGLAPKLHYCKKEPSIAGLWVVVMSLVDTLPGLGGGKEQAVEDVERAIELLHSEGLVFGDLRSPNILHVKGGGAMLVDFDWAGKAGEVRYPLDINLEVSSAQGTERNALIEMDHDRFMLNLWKDNL